MSSRKSELRPAPRPSAKIGLISDGRSITPKISAMPLSGDKLHALGVPRDFDHHRQLCPLIETGHPVLISRRLSAVDRNRKALITGGLTGLPTRRAAIATIAVRGVTEAFEPKAPPTNGLTTRT